MDLIIRPATFDDVPAIERLIAESVRALQAGDYNSEQIEGALGTVFGVDRQLIRDGTYYVAESGTQIAGCGGWSKRRTLFGSDDVPLKDDSLLDPAVDAARIRAFFVDPSWARRGVATRILQKCESAAEATGFRKLELVATLTGEPLYRTHGFVAVERFETPLRNGAMLPVVRMTKTRV